MKGTVTTGEQSWLGRLFWVDAVNMLESSMLEAAASDTIERKLYPYLTLTALGKPICQFLGLRLERSTALPWLREIAADGLINCVATPARPIWRRHKDPRKFHLTFIKSAQQNCFWLTNWA